MIIKYVLKQGNVSPCGKYYNKCIYNYYVGDFRNMKKYENMLLKETCFVRKI